MAKKTTITVIAGDEDLLRRRALRQIVDTQRKNGWEVVEADGKSPAALSDALTRSPFMEGSDRPLMVVVRNPEKISLDFLKEHQETGDGTVVLTLYCEDTPAGNTKFSKFCKDLGKAYRLFEQPKAWESADVAAEFCVEEARSRYDKSFPLSLAQKLVDVSGTDLGALTFEVQKICMLADVDGVREVTFQHTKDGVAPMAVTPISMVRDSLQRRDRLRTGLALNRIRKTNREDQTIPIVRVIGPGVLEWLAVVDLLGRGVAPEDIAIRLSINPWLLKNKIVPPLRRWSVRDLERLIHGFAEAERALLRGSVNPWIILTSRILEACG